MAQDPGSDLLGAGVGMDSVTQGTSASSVAQGFHPTVAFTNNHDTTQGDTTGPDRNLNSELAAAGLDSLFHDTDASRAEMEEHVERQAAARSWRLYIRMTVKTALRMGAAPPNTRVPGMGSGSKRTPGHSPCC